MNQLGFSRKEANGTLVLIMITSISIFIPYMVGKIAPAKNYDPTKDQLALRDWYHEINASLREKSDLPDHQESEDIAPFDPNKLKSEDWVEIGLKPYVADRISKYIRAGGHFKQASDLYKIYGIDSSIISKLTPLMIFEIQESSAPRAITKQNEPVTDHEKEEIKSKTNINNATQEELMAIRGIGEKLSARIIKYRNNLGGFYHPSQLSEVWYLPDSLLPKLENEFTFDSLTVSALPINTDSIILLSKHPYLNYNMARAIVNYRIVHGKYTSIDQLKEVKILPDSIILRLMPYLSVKDEK